MVEVTIVGIPSKNDYVWELSSEKVPHITMLYLGKNNDAASVKRITDFVEHVANTSMTKFNLPVDHRGVLGDQQADVLFFAKNDFMYQQLAQARAYMLGNEDILNAYNSTTQFTSWTPHITLGYPKTPAKNPTDGRNEIGWVYFDKIAVWTSDYAGTEILLNDRPSMDPQALSMSDIPLYTLTHHGIRGMKWGTRRSRAQLDADSHDVATAKSLNDRIKKNRGKTDSLSNKELQDLVTRMNLEQQYSKLVDAKPNKFKTGEKFVKNLISTGRTVNDVVSFMNSPTGKVISGQLRR